MTPRIRIIPLALCATLASLAAAAAPSPATAAIDGDLEAAVNRAAPGERLPVLVVLDGPADPAAGDASGADRIAALKRAAAAAQAPVDALTAAPDRRFWLVNAVATRATAGEVRELAADPRVAWVGSDQRVKIGATGGSGQSGTPWNLSQIGAPTAWSGYRVDGTGVTIGSIDTGVDAAHPGLRGKVAAWRDFVAASPTPYDDNGHGTHTIGTMVGQGTDGAALGVAPGARVVVAKAMDAKGYGSGSTLIAAAQWIADPDGNPATDDAPDVVNNSWGTVSGRDPWFRQVVRQWIALGIVPVFSAGNTGPTAGTVASPADYPESLAVGAVDAAGRVASFSARGPVTWSDPDGLGPAAGTPLVKPDVVAPGVGVSSTVPGGGEAAYSGTSMAAPHVAGIAALIRQARPDLGPAQVQDLIRRSAADLGPAGPDADSGYGLVSATAALAAAGAIPLPAPAAPAPAAAPSAGRPQPAVTLAQLRASRRVAVAAARRVNAVERRLAGPRPRPIRASLRVERVAVGEMVATRRIARAVMRRVARLEGRSVASAHAAGDRGLRLTARDARLTDRLARRALAASARIAGVRS